ncbi:MAG TPA: alanine--tRNA ligase-related protein [Candidatus Tyrphobacter sp.]|nr:alanine--tRNA ligase-related protein [Candidatus Tyrphobacter sp.]
MSAQELREKFIDFFKSRGHAVVPSSSLISDDPTVLLTTAGMQQFKKYYLGERSALDDFGSRNAVSIQKCFRTTDIEEVGDERHLTFFEMLGNFSFGGYFKREAIYYAYDFLTKELGLKIDYVTIFDPEKVPGGDWRKEVPFDYESFSIWQELGLPEEKIRREGIDNFWGPPGTEGPCGPTTEIFVKGIEVWNLVFNEYYATSEKKLKKLGEPGVDTGSGLERLLAVKNGFGDVFEIDTLAPLLAEVEKIKPGLDLRIKKILADHLRGSAFLIAEGLRPSNKEAGYILRRLLRRIVAYQIRFDIHADIFSIATARLQAIFQAAYPDLLASEIFPVMEMERDKFESALSKGFKELGRYEEMTAADAFYLYETYGLPFEVMKEMSPAAKDIRKEDFEAEFEKHREISRVGAEEKFGGHGLTDENQNGAEREKIMRLHTATHLLQAGLRKILGPEVEQGGSDITPERLRFDFSFNRKLTDEELKEVEIWVNGVINEDWPVSFIVLPIEEAKKTGALFFFKEKYPEMVKVYFIGPSFEEAISKEFCGGPHVARTGEIGRFRIIKEESAGAGLRRIRGVIE